MNVFYYDRTFEGLLTVVFDAYKLKMFPERLLTEGDVAPMFMENQFTSVTQKDKSGRVWAALQKKLSKQALNQMMYVWQSELPGSDELLFRYIRKVIDASKSIETNFVDDDVMAMIKLAKKVGNERMYVIEFVRFQKTVDGLYFAPVSPGFDVLPLAINHFIDRFADQKWVIYDEKRRYGYFYDLHSVSEMVIEEDNILIDGKLCDTLLAEDELLFQRLWQRYFKAISIKERANPRQQKRCMPTRFWHYLTELRTS
jgi:probable DNA metabolism protein